jgi:hypothetical protein
MGNLKLTSSAFSDGGKIPRHHGYKHGNDSPPLTISGIPTEAESLALIMDDPDAMGAVGKIWVHWVVWNIGAKTYNFWMDQQKYSTDPENLPPLGKYFPNPSKINIPENTGDKISQDAILKLFIAMSGLSQGTTDFGEVGYGGPAPPDKRHTYVFKLYALDIFTDKQGNLLLDVKPGASKTDLEKAMEGHIIEQATLTGTYAP